MAKMTLLQLVQDILSDMDSDEVNSINDTVESLQVAQIIKDSYYNIVNGKHYPNRNTLLKLEGSTDVDKPTHMRLPENVTGLNNLRYNKKNNTDTRDKYSPVVYKSPDDFLTLVDYYISSDADIKTVEDYSGVTLYVRTNKAPTYFTSFDDEWLVFDSYDNTVDSTLQTSKTQCFGMILPEFSLSDSFVPELPVQMFSYLLTEAKSTAFLTLKQMANSKAEQHAISQRRRMSQDAWRLNRGVEKPNYGRLSKKG